MSGCCGVPDPRPETHTACPRCGEVGRGVSDRTIQAILKAGLAQRLLAVERRFCKTQSCPVLYYGADGRVVEKDASRVRVGVKETSDPIPVCYCFNYSTADVRQEIERTGKCTIPARITAEIRAGHCACEVKSPSGACCLGEVKRAVKEVMERLAVQSQDAAPPKA